MAEQHPITPPPGLVEEWLRERPPGELAHTFLATQAARWGYRQAMKTATELAQQTADQELEACVEWVEREIGREWGAELRATRRPQPPSLKEQALSDFDGLMSELDGAGNYSNCAGRIRRALERLQELEGGNG